MSLLWREQLDSTSVIISQSTYAPAAEEKFINSGLLKMDEP